MGQPQSQRFLVAAHQLVLESKRRAGQQLIRLSGTDLGARLSHVVSTVDGLLRNDTDDSSVNGERWLLERLAVTSPKIVLDVGAHEGGWSVMAGEAFPEAVIHAFEPVPAAFRRLSETAASCPALIANHCALSSPGADSLKIWSDKADGRRSSATSGMASASEPMLLPCTTGDQYLAERSVDRVDLLKIDVEGHEMQVLEGFAGRLASGSIDVIQFEFTLWSAVARVWLADYYEFLGSFGYQIGKLYPKRVDFRPYDPEGERFLRCNYVAVRPGSPAARALA